VKSLAWIYIFFFILFFFPLRVKVPALNELVKMDKKSFETVLDEIRKVTPCFRRCFNRLVVEYSSP